jgi:hypothetical protein
VLMKKEIASHAGEAGGLASEGIELAGETGLRASLGCFAPDRNKAVGCPGRPASTERRGRPVAVLAPCQAERDDGDEGKSGAGGRRTAAPSASSDSTGHGLAPPSAKQFVIRPLRIRAGAARPLGTTTRHGVHQQPCGQVRRPGRGQWRQRPQPAAEISPSSRPKARENDRG